MTQVHVLRVFTDETGNHGNPLGVVLDTTGLDDERRQAIAAELGFSETVFVDGVDEGRLSIHTPAVELPLAGHPLVGTAWLLTQTLGRPVETLRPRLAEPVTVRHEAGLTWIHARVTDAPGLNFVEMARPEDVDALPVPPGPDYPHHEFWAWLDREAGEVRARFFAPAFGIAEDEATGSAALVLVARLGRPITIRQGRGSILYARPAPGPGYAEVGGRVVLDEVRERQS